MSFMHDLAINKDTTASCKFLPKQPIISLDADWRAYTDSGPPEPKLIYSTSPGPDLPTDAIPQTYSCLLYTSPSPRD